MDLIEDGEGLGSAKQSRLYQSIRDASDFLQKEIGWFIPVTMTRKFNGLGKSILYVPALLSVTSIVNDDDTLVSADYILQPDSRHWDNGPYTWLTVGPDATSLCVWRDEDDGVQVSGQWGMYSRVVLLGATVQDTTSQSNSQSTLKVSDGGKVSPGMLLLIGSEQELVTGWGDPTASVTTLNGAVAISDDVITLTNGALVNVGEVIRVDFEQMRVKDKRTHQVYVDRGWNGTGRTAHLTAAAVDVYRTVSVERAVNGTTAAAHLTNAAISRHMPPDDIQLLTREIATLMLNKAQGGYQGRTGSQETGTVFYNDFFPRFDLERIKEKYFLP